MSVKFNPAFSNSFNASLISAAFSYSSAMIAACNCSLRSSCLDAGFFLAQRYFAGMLAVAVNFGPTPVHPQRPDSIWGHPSLPELCISTNLTPYPGRPAVRWGRQTLALQGLIAKNRPTGWQVGLKRLGSNTRPLSWPRKMDTSAFRFSPIVHLGYMD